MKQILLLPVPAHAHKSERHGKAMSRFIRRQATQYWNQCLRDRLPLKNVWFLDYEADLVLPGHVLDPAYNADSSTSTARFCLPWKRRWSDLKGVVTGAYFEVNGCPFFSSEEPDNTFLYELVNGSTITSATTAGFWTNGITTQGVPVTVTMTILL